MADDAYAGLVSRVMALLIDVLVLVLGTAAVYLVLVEGSELMLGGSPSWVRPVAGTVMGVLPTAYFTLAWWLTGQTAGDIVMGVTVSRANGERLGFLHALLRAVVGLALAPLWLAGMVTTLIDGRRRALLDMLFGTVVRYGGARTNLQLL
ncbi:RDD family protein [Nonomuraea soli]|uniref:Putative RDD family membrane protein YckC n=1 Tax=Nonomuraea soli TaxID=1032476 RepID=A0A7W0CDH3_9ACTN|nr:RDD family protein [Nonomuraea soli]MBA2889111.1 putative RDD family membrane protein YckC [Nonomuraea soli]